jgi:hypothetical protein
MLYSLFINAFSDYSFSLNECEVYGFLFDILFIIIQVNLNIFFK